MAGAFRWYQRQLTVRPLLSQSITTAILFGTGDVMAQQIVERQGLEKHDNMRTARMASYGGLFFGPFATKWFAFLQRKVKIPNRPNLEVVTKVGLDQSVFATTNMFVFLTTMATLEGGSPKEKLESTYLPALARNWMIWPWAQFLNFKYIPLEYRVLWVNFISLGWNCYLSYLNSSSGKQYETEPPGG